MGVEILAAREALGLLKRNPTMIRRHVIGTYLLSMKDCEVGSVARSSYLFLRHIDDVLDGDLEVKADPLEYVASLRSQVESGIYTGEPEVIRFVEHSLPILEKKTRPDDNPRRDFLNLIDAMVFDHRRLKERRILSSEQLEEYYKQTFSPLNNIMLIGLGSRFRACDIPEMSFCQGRVYSFRDLETDWHKGLINIPGEILNKTGLTNDSIFAEVTKSDIVRTYFQTGLSDSKPKLEKLQAELSESSEGLTFRTYNYLIKSMLRIIEAYTLDPSDNRLKS